MKTKYLPIGSVVILRGGSKEVMINGYCIESEDAPGKVFDYRGCPYPEGIISSAGVALFNNSDISVVSFRGFENDESLDFLDKLEIIIDEHNKSDK